MITNILKKSKMMICLLDFRSRFLSTSLSRLLLISVMLCSGLLQAAETSAEISHPSFNQDERKFFQDKVKPILKEHCFKCHGGVGSNGKHKIKSGLQLISRKGMLIGGDHGPAYDSKNPEQSRILKMISYSGTDYEMPPDGKLSDEKIAIITKWVSMGLPWEESTINDLVVIEKEKNGAFEPGVVSEEAKQWWSNKPLRRPEAPKLGENSWVEHPIDAFIFDQLTNNDLKPNPKASKRELIRRAYFNLIGLPPTAGQVKAFENDDSPKAWENLIDDLLARPEYGEKWARHWLDVVRYAESNGFERDSNKDFIWRYRDYVIDSFNRDIPWNQFMTEQIAGDELKDPSKDSRIATGYLRLMQWDDEPADRLQHKYDVLDDIVRTTSEGFLGMTLGCARCHDHKADPIPQEDYYKFMAFFHGVTNHSKNNVIETIPDAKAEALAEEQKQNNAKQQEQLKKRIANFEKQAEKLFIEKDPSIAKLLNPDRVENPVILATSEKKPHKWHYTLKKPSNDWFEVSFRHEEKWKSAPAPFGNGRPGGKKDNTSWTGGDIWLRTSFMLTEIPSAVELRVMWDEDTEVYLNGQKIADLNGYVTSYQSKLLTPDALGAFQTGRNTLAVHCKNTSGGQFIDAGLKIVDRAVTIAELIDLRGKEVLSEKKLANHKNNKEALKRLQNQKFTSGIKAMVVQEYGGTPKDLHVHVRGSAHSPGDKVEPGFPAIFGYQDPALKAVSSRAKSSGRRSALAKWLSLPDNPRTSRVAVNRIWQRHFGRGITATPSDFGTLGQQPTHPKLLDWLASEFVAQGWSLKRLHKLIMTSNTYQMSSAPSTDSLEKDPANNNFWRMNMRRLDAEEIRDAILATTGKLSLEKGGPSFFPILPEAILATSSTKGGKWGRSDENQLGRRSIYIKIKRSLQVPELIDFDFADTDAPCPVRFVTTVPTQALGSLNSEFITRQASDFADRVAREAGGGLTDKHINYALKTALSRSPETWELKECNNFVEKLKTENGLDDKEALQRLCLLILNLNEFVYID